MDSYHTAVCWCGYSHVGMVVYVRGVVIPDSMEYVIELALVNGYYSLTSPLCRERRITPI